MEMRVQKQAATAQKLATWLYSLTAATPEPSQDAADKDIVGGKVVEWVWHGSLQPRKDQDPKGRLVESPGFDPRKQMHGGFSPCFSFRVSRAFTPRTELR